MRRRLLNVLTALSFLLFLAVTALCVRSYWVSDHVGNVHVAGTGRATYRSSVKVSCGVGKVSIDTLWVNMARYSNNQPHDDWYWISERPPSDPTVGSIGVPGPRRWLGFSHEFQPGTVARARCVTFPVWPAAVLSAMLPAWRLFRRRHRFPSGRCPACGYDLRATPGRCPECGRTAAGTNA